MLLKPRPTRRRMALLLAIPLCLAGMLPAAAGPHILVDMNTGRVLDQERAFDPWYPASLTKLMTVYVALRAVAAGEIQLDSPVRVSERAAAEPPSKMGYKPGSVLTVDNAIKILMVKSANDVATAMAESVGGSRQAFATRMNEEAARLGMTGTRFVNAHGLHSTEQASTARDLAILAMALRKDFPEHASYFAIEAIADGSTVMENHNTLIGRFDGATGMKTGYTCPSGFNLIATATRGGRTLMAVVIGEDSVEARADKAANLLAEGFASPSPDAPFLGAIRPSGSEAAEAIDLRPVICTEEHWKAIAEARGPEGKPVYTSPHLHEPTRPPIVVAVSLGGATGPESTAPKYADVPVPTPRPDYTPGTSETVAEGG
jgi:D-alanyl-D-alanine carboxypeptidase